MSTGNSSGESGRCDAKCYDAKGGVCHCCCGGRNHGAGFDTAVDNTREYAADMIRSWRDQHPEDQFHLESIIKQYSLNL